MPKTDLVSIPSSCTLCPRRCGADRAAGRTGFCGAGNTLKAARAALHYWEEPCISGTRGSGTVFFSGCTLKCCFCQNYPISAEGLGREITVEHLAEIFLDLQSQGAHNINLVTPGQWQPWIIAALDIARAKGLHLPILCNTGGYETVESVEAWRGYIDIWLADLKYVSSALSAELSSAPDYFAQAKPAIEAMMAQAGHPAFDAEGILQKGVILRHLTLPGHIDDSFAVLDQMAAWNDADPGCFIPSVMSQYTPFYKAAEHGIGRRITTYEYRRVVNYAMDKGLAQGYMQQKSSAKEEYTPSFDQIAHLCIVKAIKSTVQELFIGADILEQNIHIRPISHITTAFSRNKQLFPKLFIFFQKGYIMSAFCCRNGSHHTGSTAADYYHITHFHPFLPTYRRHCSLRRRE